MRGRDLSFFVYDRTEEGERDGSVLTRRKEEEEPSLPPHSPLREEKKKKKEGLCQP